MMINQSIRDVIHTGFLSLVTYPDNFQKRFCQLATLQSGGGVRGGGWGVWGGVDRK